MSDATWPAFLNMPFLNMPFLNMPFLNMPFLNMPFRHFGVRCGHSGRHLQPRGVLRRLVAAIQRQMPAQGGIDVVTGPVTARIAGEGTP